MFKIFIKSTIAVIVWFIAFIFALVLLCQWQYFPWHQILLSIAIIIGLTVTAYKIAKNK